MSNSYRPSHARQSSSRRHIYNEQNFEFRESSYYTAGAGAAHYEPPAPSIYLRSHANIHSGNHTSQYPSSISNSDLDHDPYYHYPQYSNSQEYQHNQELSRPGRGDKSQQTYRTTANPKVEEAIMHISGRTSPNNLHNRSSARQPHPIPNERHDSYEYRDHSRPLGMSNLRHLNKNRSPTSPIKQRVDADQRTETYDAAGYVGRYSDYDRPDERSYPENEYEDGHEEYEEYDETQYDGESIDNRSITF